MVDNFMANINNFVKVNIISYIQELYQYPIKLIPLIIDLAIVIFLLVKFGVAFKYIKLYFNFFYGLWCYSHYCHIPART